MEIKRNSPEGGEAPKGLGPKGLTSEGGQILPKEGQGVALPRRGFPRRGHLPKAGLAEGQWDKKKACEAGQAEGLKASAGLGGCRAEGLKAT